MCAYTTRPNIYIAAEHKRGAPWKTDAKFMSATPTFQISSVLRVAVFNRNNFNFYDIYYKRRYLYIYNHSFVAIYVRTSSSYEHI
jgi:hypothetical protein